MAGFIDMLVQRNMAPDWYYLDRKQNLPEAEIKRKIAAAISEDVDARGYSRELWTDAFIADVAGIYNQFFDKLYSNS